jgi:hypothetical protein
MVGHSGERRSERGRGRAAVGKSPPAPWAASATAPDGALSGGPGRESERQLGNVARWLVSGWLLVHLLSVVAEPLRMFSRSEYRPAAPHIWLLRSGLAPYVEFLYLAHGYFFFAPNPGPNHILEFRFRPPAVSASHHTPATPGSESRADDLSGTRESPEFDRLRLPERGKQWPRLLYHRYFMLAEFYQQLYRQAPIELEQDALRVPELWDQWQEARQIYLDVQASLRRRAIATRPEQSVEIRRLMHELPSDVLILQEGWKVNDPRLYITLPESVTELNPADATAVPGAGGGEELPSPADDPPPARATGPLPTRGGPGRAFPSDANPPGVRP